MMNAIHTSSSLRGGAPSREVEWMGTSYFMKLSAEESGGAAGVYESLCPAGSGPPLHVHHREDEIFAIREGEIEFWLDGESMIRRSGDVVFLPRGVPHTFRVLGSEPAKMLTLLTPGGFESFFAAVSGRGYKMPVNMPEVAQIGAAYGLEFRGPPPWAR
jgi:mannose-6-phosphate isomerase-like protein (cupin superfamily)